MQEMQAEIDHDWSLDQVDYARSDEEGWFYDDEE
jgi:hypothetical protein